MRPYWGSPPRVRGKVNGTRVLPQFEGITPACAGKSRGDAVYNWRKRDHPRVCGEKKFFKRFALLDEGSPPRVRGKAGIPVDHHELHGITPACAGKRTARPATTSRPRDHPRVCGEKSLKSDLKCNIVGSPPRVRGKVDRMLTILTRSRITPACAGKSSRA